MRTEKDLANASALLCECRTFIDDIMPGCAAGHDELESLKRRVDLFYFEMESRISNPKADVAPASGAHVQRVVGPASVQGLRQPIHHLALAIAAALCLCGQASAGVGVDAQGQHHAGGRGVAAGPVGGPVHPVVGQDL